MKAIPCVCPGLRQTIVVTVVHGHPWLIGDLHERNVMRDATGQPTIIDALIGPVSTAAQRALPQLAQAVGRAKRWRHEGVFPEEADFMAGDDSELWTLRSGTVPSGPAPLRAGEGRRLWHLRVLLAGRRGCRWRQ